MAVVALLCVRTHACIHACSSGCVRVHLPAATSSSIDIPSTFFATLPCNRRVAPCVMEGLPLSDFKVQGWI